MSLHGLESVLSSILFLPNKFIPSQPWQMRIKIMITKGNSQACNKKCVAFHQKGELENRTDELKIVLRS